MLRDWRWVLVFCGVGVLAGCVVGPQQLGLSDNEWNQLSPSGRDQLLANYKTIRADHQSQKTQVYKGPKLIVTLDQGYAKMSPFVADYPLQKKRFFITPGECQQVELSSLDRKHQVSMRACYNGLTLQLDPSRYVVSAKDGTIRFDYSPIWKVGFTYQNVSTSGYACLQGARVKIKALPELPVVEDDSTTRH